MVYKASVDRYKTKNNKLYLNYIFLGGESIEKWNQIFPSGKTNTKEAKEFIGKNYPEITDFLLERSQNFDWYEIFIEKSIYEKILRKEADIRNYWLNSLSKKNIKIKNNI